MDRSNKDKSCSKNSNQSCESTGRVTDSMGHSAQGKAQSQSAKTGPGMNTGKTDQHMHSGMHSGMQKSQQGSHAMSGQHDNKNSSMNMNSGAQKQHGQNCASKKGESCSQNNGCN
ncbi:hypothetical protein BGZ70_003296 [Mortierella alpina]|uniref:Uncharacterized protein n=1 Tax=Mortierella alpina TaxID=64518 RepID=A0A9P6M5A5_MORAP|nr:hypothetical protein BGZ70_003296 [Mortierella alpina]